MENTAGASGELNRCSESIEGAECEVERETIFEQLKGLCLELLNLSQNPKKDSPAILALLQILRRTPPSALQPFFDFTLFPLLLLLDTAVSCRSQEKKKPKKKFEAYDVPRTPYKVSDKVAEGVISCLEELLKKCRIRSVDQMLVILKKLTTAALLTPSEAAEEFREGIIKCFRAMISGLLPCSDDSCSCKVSVGMPLLSESLTSQTKHSNPLEYDQEISDCLLGFLQSQPASTAVGHWLSLLLKAADVEAARGHRGSASLRVEAFMALRVLTAKVGTADALAFFLPGVISQIAKVLHVSRGMISGAAGSVEALDQAIRGLAEYLTIVLADDVNTDALDVSKDVANLNINESACSFLEEFRSSTTKSRTQNADVADTTNEEIDKDDRDLSSNSNQIGSLHVERTKKWLETTTSRLTKLLCDTFPHICIHPSSKVRVGLLEAIRVLLSKSPLSLKGARLVLLECACSLAVDDSDEVSVRAQEFLDDIFSENSKYHVQDDVIVIFNRFLEKLPKVVMGNDELSALVVAKQLLVILYYSGPRFLSDHLKSPISASRFLDIFALCLSHNSAFTGSLEKLIMSRSSSSPSPSSPGYLPSITELEAGHAVLNTSESEKRKTIYELPRMPPWFSYVGSQKLYEMLAGVLRLVGLSLMADSGNERHLAVILEIPLGYFHKLVSEVRVNNRNGDDWPSWFNQTGSGQLVRQAATAVCILNEIIFGLSEQAADTLSKMFQNSRTKRQLDRGEDSGEDRFCWKISWDPQAKRHLIECVGNILHEFQSLEVWDIPVDQNTVSKRKVDTGVHDISLHFFRDVAMLHQVIIEGIGVFSLCLGNSFACSGFLHSSLYLLLESLICSNFQVRNASDAVLHLLAATSDHPSVGHLVLANADYVIDSICQQLRHPELNPHIPNVLAAMLSYIGVARDILPLLEEPMRLVSEELEIVGRQEHPDRTLPFLKAVHEIAKASKREACLLPDLAKSFHEHVKNRASDVMESGQDKGSDSSINPEEWENIVLDLNRSRSYRRIVGSIASSCLVAATPLLASLNQITCLVALDIIEEGVPGLARIEEAYRFESKTKEIAAEIAECASLYQLHDAMHGPDDGADENRLLPAMNKIWPFFVVCIRNRNSAAVRRCLSVMSRVIQISGGDFFARRFHNDGFHFWKLLTTSPFQTRDEKPALRLPYRAAPVSLEASMAEASSLKVQAAVLNMIADLSGEKSSASALDAVLKKVAGLVVGIACSGVTGLRDAAFNALRGLACMDPDLVWILLADVYYSLKRKASPPLPPSPEFQEIYRVLPLPPADSPVRFLYVEYGGGAQGFDVEFSSVETVFKRMHALVFTDQLFS